MTDLLELLADHQRHATINPQPRTCGICRRRRSIQRRGRIVGVLASLATVATVYGFGFALVAVVGWLT